MLQATNIGITVYLCEGGSFGNRLIQEVCLCLHHPYYAPFLESTDFSFAYTISTT